jgi:hypothetical protein
MPNVPGLIGSHATVTGGLASGREGHARDIAVLKELRAIGSS